MLSPVTRTINHFISVHKRRGYFLEMNLYLRSILLYIYKIGIILTTERPVSSKGYLLIGVMEMAYYVKYLLHKH